MNDHDRIILTRLTGKTNWDYVGNPRWDLFTKAQSAVLANDCNRYAETENCGVVNRMIRRRDTALYGIPADTIGLSAADPECYELVLDKPDLLPVLEALLAEFDAYDRAMAVIGRGHEDFGGQREAARVAIRRAKKGQ